MLPKEFSEIYNKFGLNLNLHEPVISYANEKINNVIIKIIENIDNEFNFFYSVCFFLNSRFQKSLFFLKSYFWTPSDENTCKNDNEKFCPCNNTCKGCVDLLDSPLSYEIELRKNRVANRCDLPNSLFSGGISFQNNSFVVNFQNENTNLSSKFFFHSETTKNKSI